MINEKCAVFHKGEKFEIHLVFEYKVTENANNYHFYFDKSDNKYKIELPPDWMERRQDFIFYKSDSKNIDVLSNYEFDVFISALNKNQFAPIDVLSLEIIRSVSEESYGNIANRRGLIPIEMFENLEVNQNG